VNAFAHAWPRRAAPRRGFAEVAEDHLDGVHKYLLLLTADSALAEDLAAETFGRPLAAAAALTGPSLVAEI
jgi:DNA-directed RNA polymerase specialized sigma24 family protein